MPGEVAIMMTLAGPGVVDATKVLATVDGVTRVDQMNDDSE
jgi:putative Mg2+ transporter-C (MgtC) family protein